MEARHRDSSLVQKTIKVGIISSDCFVEARKLQRDSLYRGRPKIVTRRYGTPMDDNNLLRVDVRSTIFGQQSEDVSRSRVTVG